MSRRRNKQKRVAGAATASTAAPGQVRTWPAQTSAPPSQSWQHVQSRVVETSPRPHSGWDRQDVAAPPRVPVLRFTPTQWAKLIFLRDYGDTEVGAFGVCPGNDLLRVEDVQMVKQTASHSYVEFDDDGVADFFDAQVGLGRKPEQFARIWIHTHPGNSAQPSGQDEETFRRVFGDSHWAVMFILAKGGNTYCRLRFNVGPGGHQEISCKVDFECEFEATDQLGWAEEYERTVGSRVIRPVSGFGQAYRQVCPQPSPPTAWAPYGRPSAYSAPASNTRQAGAANPQPVPVRQPSQTSGTWHGDWSGYSAENPQTLDAKPWWEQWEEEDENWADYQRRRAAENGRATPEKSETYDQIYANLVDQHREAGLLDESDEVDDFNDFGYQILDGDGQPVPNSPRYPIKQEKTASEDQETD